MNTKFCLILVLFSFISSFGQTGNKILFDATKAEMAGNADWVIDADAHNIYFNSTTHLPYASSGSSGASNPQKTPTPAQSGITSTTTEDYWQGAISYWGVDCAKKGYVVESLPFNGAITFGNTSNPQDLSNYKAFVVAEPNMLFSSAEKTALLNFVAAGGGLFMIADHDVSDRNYDGYDAPHIWNDLMTTNSVAQNPFGITFDYVDISGTYSNVANLPTDPILHGTAGNVTKVQWANGTTMTLNTTNNSSVKGVVFKTGTSGTTNVLCAYATYGLGKVVAVGDSSIIDDGTGDTNDTLYDGYISDAAGNHQKIIMNMTIWLMTATLANPTFQADETFFAIYPNPTEAKQIEVSFSLLEQENTSIKIYDSLGRLVKEELFSDLNSGINHQTIDASTLESGVYFCKLVTPSQTKTLRVVLK
ncbi:T9SS type A sorting domain-containing protein [Flavobacterium aciduliphilum]|uniref:Putative secreted protein (Por secretion system target) n=1 Tax=Flavobacterium aciduliphilum TaxID=1101402 RepID=A0A328Y9K8_9FLAO|nr:T9SS type A sorting domain-containing protein [Flavobacterium aciduliphilum]RAR70761.1 putative secreted protein (Por secretion system target) [Flavobacterium aciduliphilum]